MRAVIQRITEAKVDINHQTHASIKGGLLVLLGIEENDTEEDVFWLSKKIVAMRIFSDADDKMNLDVKECNGDMLVVSQFTLHALTKKGNRPSFIRAASPEKAIPLYELFISETEKELGKKVETGVFGAMMELQLVNDGPVTIIIDSRMKE
jgi:D-tyrosyl-tRNA(Tyr) deacylase